ncbi:PRA1 family protein 1 [Nematocida sp. LUAm3]|nr:PRA1 family protein 1 [Nematocida sp. LUAm3]KAI5174029.1 PRA1 family protein 1 [Nematocida sp. LUAm2]KAI5177228.1 PRA1 family protein 1 [Nematocida sp. LUAm1]
MQSRISAELTYYVKERTQNRVSFKEFVEISHVSVPDSLEVAKSRIVINYGKMFGNYLIVLSVFLCLYLIIYPLLIIPGILSGGLLYLISTNEGEEVYIMGKRFKRDHLYAVAFLTPLLFFIYVPKGLVFLFFVMSLGVIVSTGHMIFFKPIEAQEDV